MRIGLVVFSWIARHALALLLIVLVLVVARHLAPPAAAWLAAQSEALRTVPVQQAAYAEALRDFEVYAARRRAEADTSAAALARSAEERLRAHHAALGPRIDRLGNTRLTPAQLAVAAARGDSAAILNHYRAEAERALLERERRYVDTVLSARSAERESLRLAATRRAAVEQLRTSQEAWLAARARVKTLEGRFLAGPRNAFCRMSPLGVGCENYRALVAARREMEAAAARNRDARARIAAIDEARRALAGAGAAIESAATVLDRRRESLAASLAELDRMARSNLLIVVWRAVAEVLPEALTILALAISGPMLIKLVLFYAVAPLAARRPAIRLLESDQGRVVELGRSAVSQSVTLAPGEELLILPEAVQSTPHHATKHTQWLLSWAMPLSSLAAGMVALTRIRTNRPDTVLVSATGGPFAEIALVGVEPSSAMVLRPRTLRGLVQISSEPVRITRRWRFGLSAWLTLQFRFLAFHGPCILVVEGARGVRLEQAGLGRGINQASTIGFSAGLAYGVSRSETFGAYLLGKQALFNDSFESVTGVYLYEEMPVELRKGGIWRGGLGGLGDAALKLVGL